MSVDWLEMHWVGVMTNNNGSRRACFNRPGAAIGQFRPTIG